MQQSKVERVGGFLVILALASVFAWILGRRFPLIEYQPWTAIVIAAVGLAVILVGMRQELARTAGGSRTTTEGSPAGGDASTRSAPDAHRPDSV